jgi:acetyltransferase-like isoleucine patch superfamily enzyme
MLVKHGENCIIQENVILGFKYREDCHPVVIGKNALVRTFTIIYADVTIGNDFKTGHHVVIREMTTIGNKIVVGSGSIIDGNVTIGNEVKIESQVYIPTHTTIGNQVFIGPGATLTNDRYPQRIRDQYVPEGPVIEDGVTIGANAVLLPGIRIREGSFIAAGTVVTKDVPPWSLVKGNPGQIFPLPEKLKEWNKAKKW